MKHTVNLFKAMSREERIAHGVFVLTGVAGALEFHAFMPKKYLKDNKASALTFFYGGCIGYSFGIFASGVTQIQPKNVGLISALVIARRLYVNHAESKTRS